MHSPCARSRNKIAAKERASIPELSPAGYERAVFGATITLPARLRISLLGAKNRPWRHGRKRTLGVCSGNMRSRPRTGVGAIVSGRRVSGRSSRRSRAGHSPWEVSESRAKLKDEIAASRRRIPKRREPVGCSASPDGTATRLQTLTKRSVPTFAEDRRFLPDRSAEEPCPSLPRQPPSSR